MTKRSVLPLLLLFVALSAVAQTTSFTVGKSGACNAPYYYQTTHTQYCYAAPYYVNGARTGYFTIYALIDNTSGNLVPGSFVQVQDMNGNTVFSSSNVTGTPSSFTFTGPNGSATVTYGTVKVCTGRYGCHTAKNISQGQGSYTPI